MRRTLFGIRLRPKVSVLLTEVEKFYGKQVSEERFKGDDPSYTAESWVTKDGTPLIRISENTQPAEEIIAHELLHFKLQTEGFPGPVHWIVQNDLAGEDTQAFLAKLNHAILQEILHKIFYPEMREMSFEPEDHDRVLIQKIMRGQAPPPAPIADNLATFYFKFTLNLRDEELLTTINRWYEHSGWVDALKKGQQLRMIVVASNPSTPDEVVASFLRCASLVSPTGVKYSLDHWQPELPDRPLPRGAAIAVQWTR
jgi:hypothetical protein